MNENIFIHPTAEVAEPERVGAGTRIWHQVQVLPNVEIGEACSLGKGVYLSSGVRVGNKVKMGNYVCVYGATIEDEAFLAPQVSILEDQHPRATNPDGSLKTHADFPRHPATIQRGASIGANSVVLPGVIVGKYAMVAAGSVVNKDVPAHALVGGNPARQLGYVCMDGQRLDEQLRCACGRAYRVTENGVELVE